MEQSIPTLFEAQSSLIKSTELEYIRVLPSPITSELSRTTSKLIGQPYLPKGFQYPVDENGERLHFLAQLSFEEMPNMDPFPDTGILQFYIGTDHLLGLEFSEPWDVKKQLELQTSQKNFRVIYFPEVHEDVSMQLDELAPEFEESPVEEPAKLSFLKAKEYVPCGDIRFNSLLGESFLEKDGDHSDELWESYTDAISAQGCKLGGYAEFAQSDVRELTQNPEEWLLLFQIDATDEVYVMWGDGGVGNFFIEREALARKDFTNVIYNWDCA